MSSYALERGTKRMSGRLAIPRKIEEIDQVAAIRARMK
jgi:hypothetical protein